MYMISYSPCMNEYAWMNCWTKCGPRVLSLTLWDCTISSTWFESCCYKNGCGECLKGILRVQHCGVAGKTTACTTTIHPMGVDLKKNCSSSAIQFPAKAVGKAIENGLKCLGPCHSPGRPGESSGLLVLIWLGPGCYRNLSLSFFESLPFR